ncbi:hypothetical protein [Thiomicrorhabdus sp. Milos-T2]|uniref:hypothetical protein n=1 Tax=Thiomicrorhabdus sp. Milos-T2 TaxID=90814 RepID=UPI00068C6533|nr:hypothetical protein [Thiomicrorhabdus sp. Milos-T2]
MKTIIQKMTLPLLLSISIHAYSLDISDSVQLHGFVSQGYMLSPDNPFSGTKAEDGSFEFRELGLNASWEATPKLRFAGQVLSRTMDEASDGSLKVDFLLADYLAYSNATTSFGVRVGRIKSALGLYNSTRDIPSSRPGISVPNAIYFDAFRDPLLATDGINLYGSHISELGLFSFNAYAGGRELEGLSMENYLLGKDVEGEVKNVELKIFQLTFKPESEHDLNFGLSFLQVNTKLSGAQSVTKAKTQSVLDSLAGTPFDYRNYITGGALDSLFVIASAQYGYQDWLFTAEYLNIFSDITNEVLGNEVINDPVSEAFSIQAEWFTTPQIQTLIRYEELYLVNNNRSYSTVARPTDIYSGYGRGLTLGAKWLFDENWTLRGEMTVNDGTAWIPIYDGIGDVELKEHWNTYGLQLTYQF